MANNTYYAKIDWQNNTPYSIEFDDIYYSTNSGIEETKYVFLKHNDLANRFAQLTDKDTFIIGETGFGSGLNFLTTLMLWRNQVKSKAKLFFISFEKHPLNPIDITKILNIFPELDTKELLDQYYLPLKATHRLNFKHNIYLNLVIGNIVDTLPQQNFKADAWFLDGFTPTKNVEMWGSEIISKIAALSKINATFATFTANSEVRRTLTNNGFNINKSPGFNKREMLFGSYQGLQDSIATYQKPWFAKIINHNLNKKIIIVGGGISGAATAYSLAIRGYQVTLYEKNSNLALEASGNYQAILYTNFAGNYTPDLELSCSSYRYTNYLIKKLLTPYTEYAQSGLIQLAYSPEKLKQQKQILSNFPDDLCYKVNHQDIEQLSDIKIGCESGLYFPYGLWLNPQCLVAKLVDHPNIKVVLNCNIEQISYDQEWIIETTSKQHDYAPNLVLCNSHLLNQFIPTTNLQLSKTRGQITKIQDTLNLKTIVCANGYITPNLDNCYTIGATFKDNDDCTNIRLDEHQENIRQLTQHILELDKQINWDIISGQANLRAHSIDHMPLVGPIAKYTEFKQCYNPLARDSKLKLTTACPYLPGLYVNALFGAKGMLNAPLCGEMIADYIDNTPFPGGESLRQALHPNRLWIKEITHITPKKEKQC